MRLPIVLLLAATPACTERAHPTAAPSSSAAVATPVASAAPALPASAAPAKEVTPVASAVDAGALVASLPSTLPAPSDLCKTLVTEQDPCRLLQAMATHVTRGDPPCLAGPARTPIAGSVVPSTKAVCGDAKTADVCFTDRTIDPAVYCQVEPKRDAGAVDFGAMKGLLSRCLGQGNVAPFTETYAGEPVQGLVGSRPLEGGRSLEAKVCHYEVPSGRFLDNGVEPRDTLYFFELLVTPAADAGRAAP